MTGYEKIIHNSKSTITLKENELYLITNEPLNSENQVIKPTSISISENKIKDLYLTEDFLYIYDGKNLHIFSYKSSK